MNILIIDDSASMAQMISFTLSWIGKPFKPEQLIKTAKKVT